MRETFKVILAGTFVGLVCFTGYLASEAFIKSVRAEAKQMVVAAYIGGQMQCQQQNQDRGT